MVFFLLCSKSEKRYPDQVLNILVISTGLPTLKSLMSRCTYFVIIHQSAVKNKLEDFSQGPDYRSTMLMKSFEKQKQCKHGPKSQFLLKLSPVTGATFLHRKISLSKS